MIIFHNLKITIFFMKGKHENRTEDTVHSIFLLRCIVEKLFDKNFSGTIKDLPC